MDRITVILLLCVIWLKNTTLQIQVVCNTTFPHSSCVNKTEVLPFRECSNSCSKDSKCCYVHTEAPPRCPEGYIDSIQLNMCYRIQDQKSKFPPKCPFEDVLPFNYYKDVIDNIGPVWMPVRRDLSNGLGFLQWIEASHFYKTEFKSESLFWTTIKGKDCVLYYNSSYMEAVSCEEEHFSVCAYKKLDQLTDQVCDSENFCHQSDFTAKSKCFCLGMSSGDEFQPKAEFLKPYQNYVYKKLTNDTCAIGLKKTSTGSYIWSNSKQEISYTYWSSDAVFDNTHIYAASTTNGWILTEEPSSCYLFEKEIEQVESRLEVLFNYTTFSLNVIVTHPRGLKTMDSRILLYCFTNAESRSLLYRYPELNQTLMDNNMLVFSFEVYKNSPGFYWCESFRNVDSEVVKSNEFFLREHVDFYEFITILRVSYSRRLIPLNPLSSDVIELLDEYFIQTDSISHLKDYYIFRFMKILDIDETKKEILINIHLTYNKKDWEDKHDQEFDFVKALTQKTMYNTVGVKFEVMDFLSSDYCMRTTSSKQTWPRTAIGETTHSEEYCFKSDASLAISLCHGDFINGAQWLINKEKCEIFNRSSLTTTLISYNEDIQTLEDILYISKNYSLFYPLDLYLIGEIMTHLSEIYRYRIKEFVAIVSNLMEIKKEIILEAKLKMNATKKILIVIEHVAKNLKDNVEVCSKNLWFKFETAYDWAGVGVPKTNTSALWTLEKVLTLDDFITKKLNLEFGILLSLPILLVHETSLNLSIAIFFKDSFFIEESTVDKSLDFIYKVTSSTLVEPLYGPIWVFQDAKNEKTKGCSLWNFDSATGGSWERDSDSIYNSPYWVCEFWHSSYFAFTDGGPSNVTKSLIDTLETNCSTMEVVSKLHRLSRRYEEFGSVDVYLVGKILEKVHQDNEINLKLLTETVNNLHKIQRKVLVAAQEEMWATDTILHYIDQILMNHRFDQQVIVTSDNFYILMSDIRESNFSGLAILEHNQTFQMQILKGDIEIEEVANYENFISAVVLSSELKKQLEDTKVVITFFLNNAFFNENSTQSRDVGKIFGVILPNSTEFSGPVSVLNKVTRNHYQDHCSYWYYNQGVSGFWFEERIGKRLSSMVTNCEFWHTTHFALLLLDKDKFHQKPLDWITNVNCSISLASLFCIILTAVLFKKWRRNAGNKILLNFAFVIMLQTGLFYISSNISHKSHDRVLCIVIGLVLHFSVVSKFCWMLVIAFLQYKRFVKVLEGPPKHMVLKACICGWIAPLFPTLSVFLSNPHSYTHGRVGLCYPSGKGLYLGVWLPVGIVIAVNFFIFINVIYSVVYKKIENAKASNHETVLEWRLAGFLFFVLGLTWTFGFLGELGFGLVFVYLFCTTTTLQGFILFLFYIIFNSHTKSMYFKVFKKCCYKNYQ